MKLKKIVPLILSAVCAFAPISASAISVTIDKAPLYMDVEPTVINGRTLVPMRSIFESLGADVTWNPDTKEITATKDETVIDLFLNKATAYINNVGYTLDAPAVSVNGRTMVPARFVAESLDCHVLWDSYNKNVAIFTDDVAARVYQAELDRLQAERKAAAEAEAARKEAAKEAQKQAEKEKNRTIYITRTGKRYHYDNTCNGGKYFASTLREATARGLTPCQKCVY